MLGERIAERRKQLGWSQVDLAQRLGVASTRISEFESGVKTDCNLSTARRLARALGCSIDYLAATWDTQEDPAPAPAPPPGPRRRGRPPKRQLAAAHGSARGGAELGPACSAPLG
jgi:transcriptional regulator with XRE-family HTH domain